MCGLRFNGWVCNPLFDFTPWTSSSRSFLVGRPTHLTDPNHGTRHGNRSSRSSLTVNTCCSYRCVTCNFGTPMLRVHDILRYPVGCSLEQEKGTLTNYRQQQKVHVISEPYPSSTYAFDIETEILASGCQSILQTNPPFHSFVASTDFQGPHLFALTWVHQ